MKYFGLILFAASVALAQTKPVMLTEPDSVERTKILDAVREYALNYTQNLPNFICMQVTHRQEDPTGTGKHFRERDKIQEQLTYFEHQEKYKVMAVNNQMVENRDHLKMGGAMSSGEFGSMMGEIFAPEAAAEFQWIRFGKLDGVIMNVFSYGITQERSHYNISVGDGQHVISGYHGLIYARKDNNVIARITLDCDTIPPGFPVQEVKLDLAYDVYKIADREFVLPKKWEMHARDPHGVQFNSAEFSLYRKYETGATITFETEESADKTPAKPPVKKP
jgi:hypothetical protein